jgi:nucleoside 2-deoxyribosyltransferase
MKTIAYLAASAADANVLAALSRAAEQTGFRVASPVDAGLYSEIQDVLVSLIKDADLVVAHLGRDSSSVLYEIGLAHGLEKPVMLITRKAQWVPLALRGQLIITYEGGKDSTDRLIFTFKQWLTKESHNVGRRKLRELATSAPTPRTEPGERRWTTHEAPGVAFERLFGEVLSGVVGWDVTESAANRRDQAFDFIVWNHLDDPLLATLGNPIAIEVKQKLTKVAAQSLVRSASAQGLQALVLVTNSPLSKGDRLALTRAGKRHGVLALALDQSDVADIAPNALPQKLRERLIETRVF